MEILTPVRPAVGLHLGPPWACRISWDRYGCLAVFSQRIYAPLRAAKSALPTCCDQSWTSLTFAMLDAAVKNSGLEGLLAEHLSTDRVQAYKPDPRAYAMVPGAFGLRREEIAFVAFAGWDLAGAKWFGYPTYWVNRAGASADELGVAADVEAADLSQLAAFVNA